MDIILGIDFGTSNTVVCYYDNNKANILLDGNFKVIKTKIGIKNNIYTCGNYLSLDNDQLIYNFKTNIGYNNESEDFYLLIFFDHIKSIVKKKFKDTTNFKTVITVPSNFNDIQREIIKKNFINAGFNIIRIINEPSAAALAYGLNLTDINDKQILVLDLGAGTLDISILVKDDNFYEVLYSVGLNNLGGNNFTQVIYDFILKQINISDIELYNKIINNQILENKLWYICQNAKEKLSWLENYEIKFETFSFILNITKFENLSNVLLDKFTNLLDEIKINFNQLNYIIMVGLSTKIPIIKNIVQKIFNIKPWSHPNLESVVAEGACLYGAILENVFKINENIMLLDILPLSLGVETADGNFSIIIPKDTPIPVKKTNKYTTDSPELKNVIIKVYQGERLIANKNTLIGEFIFDKLSTGGKPQIDITFNVDSNSIITVTITDKKSGNEKNILIKNIPKLNEEEIKSIIDNANINNKIDEEEIIRCNRTYLLNNQIELAINNVTTNNLLDEERKNQILADLLNIESKINNSDNINLLNMLNYIEDNYSNLIKNNTNDETDNLEEISLLNELKFDLQNKIILLLNKNPEWNEYLTPILEKLLLSNITLDYIHDKLDIIKDLENIDDDNCIDYYDQYKNVCLFIKTQIEEGLIELNNMDELVNLINSSLILIQENDSNINWEEEFNKFNLKCESIK